MANYNQILQNGQSVLRTLIYNNATVAAITTKVLDGVPTELIKGTGFPYIIVHMPRISEDTLRIRRKRVIILSTIEVWDKRESVVRTLCDAIRQAVVDGDSSMKAEGFFERNIDSSGLDFTILTDNTALYTGTITISYKWDEV